jgi:hypothetical protein
MRKMRETIEDIEDAQTIERAKKANGNKPRIPWTEVKKELGFDFSVAHRRARIAASSDGRRPC